MKRLCLLPLLFVCAGAFAQSVPAEARAVFDQYVALEAGFDPAVADLYADDAVIRNTRRQVDGTSETRTLPARTYKELIRTAMPMAKVRGDSNRYSSVRTRMEKGGVRVTASRYSNLKRNETPLSLLIAQRGGRWLIVEEISESIAIAVNFNKPIPELTLMDGRKLTNVFVTGVAADGLWAAWRGGKGKLPNELLPEEYREAAAKMRAPKPDNSAKRGP